MNYVGKLAVSAVIVGGIVAVTRKKKGKKKTATAKIVEGWKVSPGCSQIEMVDYETASSSMNVSLTSAIGDEPENATRAQLEEAVTKYFRDIAGCQVQQLLTAPLIMQLEADGPVQTYSLPGFVDYLVNNIVPPPPP